MSGIDWVARQLSTRPVDRLVTDAPKGSSSRAGVICEGSATDAVLAWLESRKQPKAFWTCAQIVAGTGRSQKAVCWALIFLRTTLRVDTTGDPRNPRYLRYRKSRSD